VIWKENKKTLGSSVPRKKKNQFFGGQRGPCKEKKRRLVTRLKSKVGLALAKAAVLRIVINLDGAPIASKFFRFTSVVLHIGMGPVS
jgi:hypothetical protein